MRLETIIKRFDEYAKKHPNGLWVEVTPALLKLARERLIAGAEQYGASGFLERGGAQVYQDLLEEEADVIVYRFFLELLRKN